MTNYHIIEASFIGATDTKGSRCKLRSHRFEQTLIIPWDYKFTSCNKQAESYLKDNGYNIIGQAEGKNSYLIITDTFRPLKGN